MASYRLPCHICGEFTTIEHGLMEARTLQELITVCSICGDWLEDLELLPSSAAEDA